MIELHKEGIIPHVQVHDELDISIGSEKEAQRIKDIMEGAVTLEVPNKVDYEFGKNWGEIKQEATMQLLKETIEHMWKDHRKMVIGAGVVLVILIIAAL